ncbi:hypothetical protein E2C01_041290 [Portunus trituberculatus]|uniref:Uncharacterized protein n=1 Tax=Portunus trituberculatus TaxID=210409 RepID=A0A5B7FJN3_PORTR|nr:hypothetical protein [Portunus trituberculatus]
MEGGLRRMSHHPRKRVEKAVGALNLAHLQGAFYLLFLGCGMAFILMVWESFMDVF